MGRDETRDDRQTQAGTSAGTGARSIRAVEALENPGGVLGAHARSVIGDLQDGAAAGDRDAHRDGRPGRGMRVGVAHQVRQHLTQPRLVAENDRSRPRFGQFETGVVAGRNRTGVVHRVGCQQAQVHWLAIERALLIETGQQQQVLDEQAHAFGLALDAAHHAVFSSPVRDGPHPVQLGEPANRRQRGTQLVAGVSHETAHPVGGRARLGLGGLPLGECGFDLGEHLVERPGEPAHLGAVIGIGNAAAEVSRGDRLGRPLDLHEAPQ